MFFYKVVQCKNTQRCFMLCSDSKDMPSNRTIYRDVPINDLIDIERLFILKDQLANILSQSKWLFEEHNDSAMFDSHSFDTYIGQSAMEDISKYYNL